MSRQKSVKTDRERYIDTIKRERAGVLESSQLKEHAI